MSSTSCSPCWGMPALLWSMSCSSDLGVSPLFPYNSLLFPSFQCFLVFLKYITTKAWPPLLMGSAVSCVWSVPWGAGWNGLEPSVSSTENMLACSQENTCLIPAVHLSSLCFTLSIRKLWETMLKDFCRCIIREILFEFKLKGKEKKSK